MEAEKTKGIIISNDEQETNQTVAKIMRITSFFMIGVLVLNIMNIFIIDMDVMFIVTFATCVALWIPTFLISRRGWRTPKVKYISIGCAVIAVTIIIITLSYHAVLFYIYPMALSSLYFN